MQKTYPLLYLFMLIATINLVASDRSFAQAFLKNDPNRPVKEISKALDILPSQFINCFMNVNPEVSKQPSKSKQMENKAILLPCLQEANPLITNDRLDEVMDHYRPK